MIQVTTLSDSVKGDVHMPYLTVRETLEFAAFLQLPEKIGICTCHVSA
jgi:ABC-type multidrug transport system ATPase subunit